MDPKPKPRPIPKPLLIPGDLLRRMVDHCRRDAPREACGLLTGVGVEARTIAPLRNALESETLYEADSRDLIEAIVAMRAREEAIVAIYHSHPRWPAIPSRTDLARNYYGDVPRIIVSLQDAEPVVRAWHLAPGSYEELPWVEAAAGVEGHGGGD